MGYLGMLGRPRLLAALFCVALGATLLLGAPLLQTEPGAGSPEIATEAELAIFDQPVAEPTLAAPAEIVIYVSGAVAAPDVYRLPAGARIKDAVLAAGGLVAAADPAAVNLAAPLVDAQHIHIPLLGAAVVPVAAQAASSSTGSALLDLNSASPAALEELPGIGATLAARIVAYRESNGPFTSIEGLSEVPGIGAKLYDQIAPLVTVGP